jgi:hypothetical protein
MSGLSVASADPLLLVLLLACILAELLAAAPGRLLRHAIAAQFPCITAVATDGPVPPVAALLTVAAAGP